MDPLSDRVARALVQRTASLLVRHGDELGDRPLVLPTNEFFPDLFEHDERSLDRLVARMKTHAGLDDIPLRARVLRSDSPVESTGGCGSGACAAPSTPQDRAPRLVEDGEGWRIQVPEAELRHPVVLTAVLARVLGHVFLVETVPDGEPIEPPLEVSADLAGVALGFGALLLEGAYLYSKSCGGPQIAQVTHLGVQELALLTAIFAEMRKQPLRPALRELSTTQRAALKEAEGLVKSNRPLVAELSRDPRGVAEGHFELSEHRPWLLRVFGQKRPADSPPADFSETALEQALRTLPAAAEPQRAPAPDPKRDELKALVDEALKAPEASADAE